MSGKAPERILEWESDLPALSAPHFREDRHGKIEYVLASEADEWKRHLDIMKKALLEIEMFQGPAAYERLPGMARKALDECGVER